VSDLFNKKDRKTFDEKTIEELRKKRDLSFTLGKFYLLISMVFLLVAAIPTLISGVINWYVCIIAMGDSILIAIIAVFLWSNAGRISVVITIKKLVGEQKQ